MIKNLNGINGTIAVQRNPLNCILKYESDAEYPNGQPARSEPAQSTTKTKKIQGADNKKPRLHGVFGWFYVIMQYHFVVRVLEVLRE